MTEFFDPDAIRAAFAQPDCDGRFSDDFARYLRELGETRPSVVLAFAPKAAGTYLRAAAVEACGGQFVRTIHAQGGRDASFYLPTWLNYFAHGFPARTLVTHVHMQALPANQALIEALGLKPVIMLRPIADMLASYADMLDAQWREPDSWINIRMPVNFGQLGMEQKGDFLIDMIGPWYASYFSSWIEYAGRDSRVLMLDFDRFLADPADTMQELLAHSNLECDIATCERALNDTWKARSELRFNRGVAGRGAARFTSDQHARLARLVDYYPALTPVRDRLIPPRADVSAARSSSAAA